MQKSSESPVAEVKTRRGLTDTQMIQTLRVKPAAPLEELPLDRAWYWETEHPRRLFLTQPIHGRARHWHWAEVMQEARRMAAFLKAQNWPPGSQIVILSKNCAWWIMAEFAIWMSGHVTVPIYTSVTPEFAAKLLDHCSPVACFLGPLDNPELVSELHEPLLTIAFPNAPPSPRHRTWDQIVNETQPLEGHPKRAPEDIATIIYTSGTTGPPKGAVHDFRAFAWFAKAVEQVTGRARHHRAVSYLPLAHIAERALTETSAIYFGWHIFFCESIATFLHDLKRARPTVFFSVPRLYAKFQAGVFEKLPPAKLETLLKIPLVSYFVRRRILAQLGLNRVRFAASGSAPIALDLVLWYRRLGLPIVEGYGSTESGITHTAPRGEWRAGSVGKSAPKVETRIAADGEIQVKSPMNMAGYYRDPDATRAVFTSDGFVRSGDLGEIDAEGWLYIKGRIKEQFKTTKGKYVSPGPIERMLETHPAIENRIVLGSGLPQPIAIATLTADAHTRAATETGRDALARSLAEHLQRINAQLAHHEHVELIALTNETWTIANGLLTPTLKLRRAALEEHYAPQTERWRAQRKPVIWCDSCKMS